MINWAKELSKRGMKFTICRPRKLSPEEEKRHRKVQKCVRAFLKRMDQISRSTGKSTARFYAKAVAHHSNQGNHPDHTCQKTRD